MKAWRGWLMFFWCEIRIAGSGSYKDKIGPDGWQGKNKSGRRKEDTRWKMNDTLWMEQGIYGCV